MTASLPISVNASAIPDQLASTLRAFLLALGGYLAGKGWIDGTLASTAVPLLLVAGPYLWNQMRIRSASEKMQVLADYAPDDIGKVG